MMVEEFRRQKKELDEKFDREKTQMLPDGKEGYKVETWIPRAP